MFPPACVCLDLTPHPQTGPDIGQSWVDAALELGPKSLPTILLDVLHLELHRLLRGSLVSRHGFLA